MDVVTREQEVPPTANGLRDRKPYCQQSEIPRERGYTAQNSDTGIK